MTDRHDDHRAREWAEWNERAKMTTERLRLTVDLIEEQQRRRYLDEGQPLPARRTVEQMRAELAELRAENDRIEAEQIADIS